MKRSSIAAIAVLAAMTATAQDTEQNEMREEIELSIEKEIDGEIGKRIEEEIEVEWGDRTREAKAKEEADREVVREFIIRNDDGTGGGWGSVHVISPDMQKFMRIELPEVLEQMEKIQLDVERNFDPRERARLERDRTRLLSFAREFRNVSIEVPEIADDVRKRHALETEADELARKYAESGDKAEKERLRTELRETLDEAFALSVRIREHEAEQIEKELGEIKSLLEERRRNRVAIVERRMSELLDGVDPYEW